MKIVKISIIVLAVALLAFGLSSTSFAFHSGGVAECEGCHTMHNTKTQGLAGPTVSPIKNGVGVGAIYLLQGTDQSSTCLNCHNQADSSLLGTTNNNGYHISTDGSVLTAGVPPVELTPGGDFGWLKKTYNFSIRGGAVTDDGDSHGHNINAVDYGYTTDKSNAAAPGGTYPAASLACSSCHDPHGRTRRLADGSFVTGGTGGAAALPIFNSGSYATSAAPTAGTSAVGAYRILGGANYLPKSVTDSTLKFGSSTNPPVAVAPGTYNRSEETSQTHVAYGSGMSEWCGNCHSAMLENTYSSGVSGHRHPAGNSAKITSAIAANYNTYVKTGDMSGTLGVASYNTLVPFEQGKTASLADVAALKAVAVNTDTVTIDATTGNVMCLSCHRAHASGFPDMTRYFLEGEFMTIADSTGAAVYDTGADGKVNYGKNLTEQTAAYYGRPATKFAAYQRDLCNKCHAKD